jgi:GTP cyclohydrolase II
MAAILPGKNGWRKLGPVFAPIALPSMQDYWPLAVDRVIRPRMTVPAALVPDAVALLARARSDLRLGLPVLVQDGATAAVVVAAEALRPEVLAGLRALGPVTLALTAHRAATLKARTYDGDLARIMVPADVDALWVRALADPADDLLHPMKGPLRSLRGGPAGLHRAAIRLAKAAHLLPAALVVEGAAPDPGWTRVPAAAICDPGLSPLQPVVAARVPLDVAAAGRLHVFRPEDGGDEHYAVEIGNPPRDSAVLARLHSACFTGDVLGSVKCDCGPQLRGALRQMGAEGAGVLLYLNQEGRGIGLANKMRAYALQDQGFDTVEANHRLGFEDDERDFRIGAAILLSLGFRQVRLMTNNPAKVSRLQSCGIAVTARVSLTVGHRPENAAYLATKAAKSGHLF